jgi:hypothetical protein
MTLSPSLMSSSAVRIRSTGTGFSKRTWMRVPPEKSIP